MPAPIVVIGAKQLLGSSKGQRTLATVVGAVVALVVGALVGVVVLVGAGGNVFSGGAGAAAAAANDENGAQTCFAPGTGKWTIPIGESYTVTSEFGDPRSNPSAPAHTGIDLASGSDHAPIYAASSGRITEITNLGDSSYGLYVRISHGGGVETLYAHLRSVKGGIRQGVQVKTGQRIATEGDSGGVTGPHLHYETILRGTPINPRDFMKRKDLTFDGKPGGATTGTNADTQGTPVDESFALPKPDPNDVDQAVPGAKAGRVPKRFLALYKKAGKAYGLPWQLLAGVGWEESRHTAGVGGSSAGAQGPMQFMPSTWEAYGVDGNNDGKRDIHDPADAIPAAASYLKANGATNGGNGVKGALYAYNHASWYVNDVLTWAWQYAKGGAVTVQQDNCVGGGNNNVGDVADGAVADVLEFAASQEGDGYVMGGVGPHYWDCSGLVMKAYARIGLTLPRTARDQRAWLANGHGTRIRLGNEKPGDLVFYDSYRGPDEVGHVAIVWNAKKKKTIEAANPSMGVGFFSYADDVDSHVFEIWRPGKS